MVATTYYKVHTVSALKVIGVIGRYRVKVHLVPYSGLFLWGANFRGLPTSHEKFHSRFFSPM